MMQGSVPRLTQLWMVPRCISTSPALSFATTPSSSSISIARAIEMELDDGVVAKLKAGDVLIQRGTIHNWVNRGTEPCIIAFVLISSKPVTAAGKTLNAVG